MVLWIAIAVLAIAVIFLYNKREKFGLNQFSALRAEAKAKTLIENHSAAANKFNETASSELESAEKTAKELEKQAAETRKAGEEAYAENTALAEKESTSAKKYRDILADM